MKETGLVIFHFKSSELMKSGYIREVHLEKEDRIETSLFPETDMVWNLKNSVFDEKRTELFNALKQNYEDYFKKQGIEGEVSIIPLSESIQEGIYYIRRAFRTVSDFEDCKGKAYAFIDSEFRTWDQVAYVLKLIHRKDNPSIDELLEIEKKDHGENRISYQMGKYPMREDIVAGTFKCYKIEDSVEDDVYFTSLEMKKEEIYSTLDNKVKYNS